MNRKVLGLNGDVTLGVEADAKAFTESLLSALSDEMVDRNEDWVAHAQELKKEWRDILSSWTKEGSGDEGRMRPRQALAELTSAFSGDVVVSTDIGNICSVANSYLEFRQPRSFLAALT